MLEMPSQHQKLTADASRLIRGYRIKLLIPRLQLEGMEGAISTSVLFLGVRTSV